MKVKREEIYTQFYFAQKTLDIKEIKAQWKWKQSKLRTSGPHRSPP
jgi:hypothetical protein